MSIEEIRAALEDRNLRKVADATGLHHNTLLGIRSGKVASPSFGTLDVLRRYLERV